MRNNSFIVTALALGLTLLCAAGANAEGAAPLQLDKLQRADGAKVVPERFLRSWDPVTVFFDRDAGPASGGPEDAPERFVTLKPATPGAWQWLGARALQFRTRRCLEAALQEGRVHGGRPGNAPDCAASGAERRLAHRTGPMASAICMRSR